MDEFCWSEIRNDTTSKDPKKSEASFCHKFNLESDEFEMLNRKYKELRLRSRRWLEKSTKPQ